MKKFKSATGKPVRISLVEGGHTIVIPHDTWREVPAVFHDQAYANRCISDDMGALLADAAPAVGDPDAAIKTPAPDERAELIKAEMRRLVAEHAGDSEMFTNVGAPDANILSGNLDIPISAAERNVLWAEVELESGE